MIFPHHGRWPVIHETAFVAPSADVIGEVEVGSHSSIWFQVVVRGDVHSIRIGERTNIQDHSMLHVTRKRSKLHGSTLRFFQIRASTDKNNSKIVDLMKIKQSR